jgi:hypothetical protein
MFTTGGGPSSTGYGNGGLGLIDTVDSCPGIGVLGGRGGGSTLTGGFGRCLSSVVVIAILSAPPVVRCSLGVGAWTTNRSALGSERLGADV